MGPSYDPEIGKGASARLDEWTLADLKKASEFADLGIDKVETRCYIGGDDKGITSYVILTPRDLTFTLLFS